MKVDHHGSSGLPVSETVRSVRSVRSWYGHGDCVELYGQRGHGDCAELYGQRDHGAVQSWRGHGDCVELPHSRRLSVPITVSVHRVHCVRRSILQLKATEYMVVAIETCVKHRIERGI